MAIKHIKISNFKSFKKLDLDLGAFNVLIGANASGKSNFVQILQFLRDICGKGIHNAISLQGGVPYLRNLRLRSSEPLSLEVTAEHPVMGRSFARMRGGVLLGIKATKTTYRFSIKFSQKGSGFTIVEDRLAQEGEIVQLEVMDDRKRPGGKIAEKESMGTGSVTFSNANGLVRPSVSLPTKAPIQPSEMQFDTPFLDAQRLPPRTLLIERPWWFAPYPLPFADVAIYDFDPKLPKKAVPITGEAELEGNAGNLAIAIKAVIQNRERKRRFSNLVADLLPFAERVDVETFADKSLLFKLRESFFGREFLPASFISDGTINVVALVLALYFQEKALTIIEEPERNVHPHLISRLVAMMKDASKRHQIIVTTHNPGIVRHADLSSILLVSRDKEGFSRISRPGEKEEVQTFLENEIGIDELFTQSVLESLA